VLRKAVKRAPGIAICARVLFVVFVFCVNFGQRDILRKKKGETTRILIKRNKAEYQSRVEQRNTFHVQYMCSNLLFFKLESTMESLTQRQSRQVSGGKSDVSLP